VDSAATVISSLYIDLCIFEILASDNRTLEEALAAYNESVVSGTYNGNLSLIELVFSDAALQSLGAVLSQTCPGLPACSGRGTCQDSVCTCSEGIALSYRFTSQKETTLIYQPQPHCGFVCCRFSFSLCAFINQRPWDLKVVV